MDSKYLDVALNSGNGRRCRVLFSYTPMNDDELTLQVDDEIDFLAEVEDGWWKGKLGNKIGVFPSNFVYRIKDDESCPSEGEVSAPLSSPESAVNLDDAPVLPPKPVKETCRVLFAYDAVNDDELTLKRDDIITIITKEVGDKGWWKGELRGRVGLFPDNFVEVITPPEDILLNQQKKPDRPSKTFDKVDSKASTPTLQKILQDNTNLKGHEEKLGALKTEGPLNKKNMQNSDKAKSDSTSAKFPEKNLNLFPIKGDFIASHRKSAEIKSMVAKKPVLPPPLTNKPKPTSGKPSNVKRLSEEINDLLDNNANKSSGNLLKRLSGDVHDLIDGAVGSKLGCFGHSPGGAKEEFDLDMVERSDMLTHITSTRPRPPGRRLPTKEPKETENPLTNGNIDNEDKEKSLKEREWEKNKPPWVNELKLNLKTTKTSPNENKSFEKKSVASGQAKSTAQSPVDGSSCGVGSDSLTTTNNMKQFGPQSGSSKVQSVFETGSKVSELSSKFSSVEKAKHMTSVSPSKTSEVSWNSFAEHSNDELVHVSRREFVELKSKVDKLEKIVVELMSQLTEEIDKRKLMEKELNKLTDLVTQV